MIHAVIRTKNVNPKAKMWLLISPCVVGELAMRPIAPIDRERPNTRSARVSIRGRGRLSPGNGGNDMGSPSFGADAVQEIADDSDVMGPLFPHGQVGALLEPHELGAADPPMNALCHAGRDFVVSSHGHEGRDSNCGQLVRDITVSVSADVCDIVLSIPRVV